LLAWVHYDSDKLLVCGQSLGVGPIALRSAKCDIVNLGRIQALLGKGKVL